MDPQYHLALVSVPNGIQCSALCLTHQVPWTLAKQNLNHVSNIKNVLRCKLHLVVVSAENLGALAVPQLLS